MTNARIRFEKEPNVTANFRRGVSLHSHTLHSRETLDFIYRLAEGFAPIRPVLQWGQNRHRALHGYELNLKKAWWTPPLSPHDAWKVETDHIRNRFRLDALVSLTDHDSIEAPLLLRVLDECRNTPVSVEWTVPAGGTFVHLGVHNLPIESARTVMGELAAYTADPQETQLGALLSALSECPETLIVFNHPLWDEKRVGRDTHRHVVCDLLRRHRSCFHAIELNGMRPWRENREAIDLARDFDMPVISGGDRHGLEPNTMLNLSNAATFDEFAAEIRAGYSDVLITNQYEEAFLLRIAQNLEDILADYENHGLGWRRWNDRVFYEFEDGVARPISELCAGGAPWAARMFASGIQALKQSGLRQRFRAAFRWREEVAL